MIGPKTNSGFVRATLGSIANVIVHDRTLDALRVGLAVLSLALSFSCSEPPVYEFTAIDVGSEFDCGITTDSGIQCWGGRFSGFGSRYDTSFTEPPSGGEFDLIVTGAGLGCAIGTSNEVACWGWDFMLESLEPPQSYPFRSLFGVLKGVGAEDGDIACWPECSYADHYLEMCRDVVPPTGTFSEIEVGGCFYCGLRSDQEVICSGHNYYFVDADGNGADKSFEDIVPLGGSFQQISAGFSHVCGIREDGTVECWGRNDYGQATPPPVSFVQLDSAIDRTCGVTTTGRVWCWGRNPIDDVHRNACMETPCSCDDRGPTGGPFVQVSVGHSHACALREDGTVSCWGDCCGGMCDPPC